MFHEDSGRCLFLMRQTVAALCALIGSANAYVASPQLRVRGAARAARAAGPFLVETESAEKQTSSGFGFFQKNVPADQQPVAELQQLRGLPFYDWAQDEGYEGRIRGLYAFLMLFISLPVSFATYPNDPAQLLLCAHIGTSFALIPFVFRLRTGWGFVFQRLKDRATYYEANGAAFLARKDREVCA